MIDQQRVLSSYNDGVQAVGYWARRVDPSRPHVCGHWTARDTAGHVLAVSRWYHEWLDRAEAGSSSPPFVAAELAERNAAALAAGPNDLEYLALIERFQEHADRYADRVAAAWDVAYGFPFGTVTAGLHAGAAAAEWHLHAWDFATAAGGCHKPGDPEGLFLGAGMCMAVARGGLAGAVLQRSVPLGARRKPWEQLLRQRGRSA